MLVNLHFYFSQATWVALVIMKPCTFTEEHGSKFWRRSAAVVIRLCAAETVIAFDFAELKI